MPSDMVIIKNVNTNKNEENVEKLKTSNMAPGKSKWCHSFGKWLDSYSESVIIQPSNFTLALENRRVKSKCSHIILY